VTGTPREGDQVLVPESAIVQGTAPVANNPRIEGTLASGSQVEVKYDWQDAENDQPDLTSTSTGTFFRWFRDNQFIREGRGETFRKYTLGAADVGKKIHADFWPRSATGTPNEGAHTITPQTAVVQPPPDTPTASNLSISGKQEPGETLTAAYSYSNPTNPVNGAGTPSYRWYWAFDAFGSGYTQISGATGSTLVVPASLNGRHVGVEITPRSINGVVGAPASYWTAKSVFYEWQGVEELVGNQTDSFFIPVSNRSGNAPSNLRLVLWRNCQWMHNNGGNLPVKVRLVSPNNITYNLSDGPIACQNGDWSINASGSPANGNWRVDVWWSGPNNDPSKVNAAVTWIGLQF